MVLKWAYGMAEDPRGRHRVARQLGTEIPPTGKSVLGRGAYFAHIRNGKILRFSTHPDVAGLMMQLGLMPQA